MTLTIIALLALIMSCAAVVLALTIRKDLQKADAQQSVYAEELGQQFVDVADQLRQQMTEMIEQSRLQNEELGKELVDEIGTLKSEIEDKLEEVGHEEDEEIESGTELTEDELYESAKEAVISAGKASTSYLQRKLGVGYSRAAQLMDKLEDGGVIGPANGSKPREVVGE
jgi:DNA segregation ATPase FtsK/SpoIIIE-like protein